MNGRPLHPADPCTQPLPRRTIRVRHGRLVWHLTPGDAERGRVVEDAETLERLMRETPRKGAA